MLDCRTQAQLFFILLTLTTAMGGSKIRLMQTISYKGITVIDFPPFIIYCKALKDIVMIYVEYHNMFNIQLAHLK